MRQVADRPRARPCSGAGAVIRPSRMIVLELRSACAAPRSASAPNVGQQHDGGVDLGRAGDLALLARLARVAWVLPSRSCPSSADSRRPQRRQRRWDGLRRARLRAARATNGSEAARSRRRRRGSWPAGRPRTCSAAARRGRRGRAPRRPRAARSATGAAISSPSTNTCASRRRELGRARSTTGSSASGTHVEGARRARRS